jgi:hypothetical protein
LRNASAKAASAGSCSLFWFRKNSCNVANKDYLITSRGATR